MPKRLPKLNKRPSTSVIILFIFGLLLTLSAVGWNFYQSRVLSFNLTMPIISSPARTVEKADPTTILIPTLAIELPIVESQIKNGTWEINPRGASHLASSASPGEGNNVVIYGHNKADLFGKAISLKVGDQIKIISADKEIYSYKIFETKVVEPTEVSVLLPTDQEILTFYTCTGLLDSKRFIVRAKPDNQF